MRRIIVPILLGLMALGLSACQTTEPMVAKAMVRHWSMLDLSGLRPLEQVDTVKASLAVPAQWVSSHAGSGLFYTHRQWRSPSGTTAVGIVYVRLPFPLSGETLLHLAERQYTKEGKGGRILDEWTDSFGRFWFVGENQQFHGRGYVLIDGLKAWVVYVGYKREMPTQPMELALGQRSLESVLPRGVTLAARRTN